MGLLGVALLNALFLALGYALLAALGARPRWWDAGVALLLGAGVAGTGVFLAVILGARANLLALGVVSILVLAAAAAIRRLRLPPHPAPRRADAPSLVGGSALGAVGALALVGGFRSAPWLSDAWGIWLPKGVALLHRGLDERLFAPSTVYVPFEVLDYPLWWSVLAGLDVRAVGEVDVRALNAQLGLLAVGHLAALARLLWDAARPWLVTAGVALVALSPEFFRQAQGGPADLPLACFVSLAALAGALWILDGLPLHLGLAAVFAAVAVQVKTEGLAEIAILLAVGLVVARRRVPLAVAGGAALATGLPWLLWQRAHDVPARTPLGDAFDPGYLAGRADRVPDSVLEVLERLVDPTDWLVVVPLFVALSVALAWCGNLGWLAPLAASLLTAAFLVWAYWANRDELGFLLATSAYRVVDPLVLTAAAFVPLLGERLLRAARLRVT